MLVRVRVHDLVVLHSALGALVSVRIAAGEARGDRLAGVQGRVGGPAVLDEASFEAEVGMALGLEAAVLVLADIHSTYLHHSAYSQVVNCNPHLVVVGAEVVVACFLRQKSWFVYVFGSYLEERLRRSLFEIDLEEEMRRRCWRRQPPFGNWKNAQTHSGGAVHPTDLADNLPSRPPTVM
jgi:hypothetical protein